jgi:hypothetical protein
MNWTRIVVGGLLSAVVTWLLGFLLHGILLADTYASYSDVFSQEASNPLWFLLASVALQLIGATIFARTRAAWNPGWNGGLVFGLWIGLLIGCVSFYWPLVIAGFPYYLAWCWLGVDVITYGLGGVVLGIVIQRRDG